MTSPGEVRIDNEVSEADEAAVVRGLLTFNEKWLGPSNDQPVRFVARDELGVVGGVLGHTRWNWLYVAKLWVDARARGRGIGTQLLMGRRNWRASADVQMRVSTRSSTRRARSTRNSATSCSVLSMAIRQATDSSTCANGCSRLPIEDSPIVQRPVPRTQPYHPVPGVREIRVH